MNKKTKILIGIGLILTLGIGVGVFYLIRYEIKLYNTVIVNSVGVKTIDDFLSTTFKDQVDAYIQAKQNTSLPAKVPTK